MTSRKIVIGLLVGLLIWGVVGCRKRAGSSSHLSPYYSSQHDWVGEKVVFLPKPRSLQRYGYQDYAYGDDKVGGKIGYNALTGKTAEIVGYKGGSYKKIALRLEGANSLIYTTIRGNNINGIGFVSEMEEAQKLLGKTVWNKANSTELSDRSMHDHINCTREIGTFEKMQLIGVEWGNYESSPIKFVFKTEDGLSATWEGSYSRINDTDNNLLKPFSENWYLEDPQVLFVSWGKKVMESIESKKIFAGMTKEQVLLSWGEPKKRNTSVGSWGVHEQWVYGSQYLYFKNGVLSSYQTGK
ncbi:MAG: hypothetical protein PF442_09805 [Desulfobulbaceae bacterium]|jgi:hypothetical protein|nr:hypothetical protein [Desulfobulbaceae bacterium]